MKWLGHSIQLLFEKKRNLGPITYLVKIQAVATSLFSHQKQIDLIVKGYQKEFQELQQEAEKMIHLQSRFIIRIKSYFKPYPFIYIVMEYADGGDLSEKISQHKKQNKYILERVIIDWFT